MATQAQMPTLVRCERCKAVISSAEASDMIRHGCGVCGGTLSLCSGHRTPPAGAPRPSAERRMLGVLREADGRPVGLHALAEAGIDDPAGTIYELERAGHRIERAYAELTTGRRRLLGYRLRGAQPQRQAGGSQPSSSL
jgi:hypothetical protein